MTSVATTTSELHCFIQNMLIDVPTAAADVPTAAARVNTLILDELINRLFVP